MKRCTVIMILAVAALAGLIAYVDRQPVESAVSYADALALTDAARVPWVTPNSPEEAEAFARFKSLWSDLTEARVRELLPRVYDDSIWFNDTVKTITDQATLLDYMLTTAGHVQSCRVEIKDIAYTDQGYYVRWDMHVVPKRARPGEVWSSIGITHLRINEAGRVILHQDYWDAAGGLYEHFPFVGWLIRNIRARL
ncbi:MAG TPA: hypothetical protein PKE26_06670 [Kiritimatiellia bacterium]|nr:hypothetical protein [Kiritimatiellia bacterium]HMO98773.1 hypothetical protein [Kiritimatiellia bacterium]HMP97974.1 hypothetical protein [Kiritimatiellia bacterium]